MRVSRRVLRDLAGALLSLTLFPVAAFASWALDGNRVVDPTALAASAVMVASDSGDVYMAWIDARSGYNTDVRATLWTSRGLPHTGWTASGDLVTAVTCTKYDLAGAPDGSGGAFLAWSDNRCTGYRNVYLGHVPRAGLTGLAWPTNCVLDASPGVVVAGTWRRTLDLSVLAPGVYLVRAEQAGVGRTRRLILLR